jgi:D-tagatose-1,6-bisphosphate aldolase subunit GatZ/KbaZ
MSHPLDDLLQAQKRGEPRGIPSICSAHPWVLKTALQGTDPVLVESTCNQVNQFGGYTGMTPEMFVKFVHKVAAQNNFSQNKILMGGDHLGPFPWQQEPAASAMSKATEMVRLYALNGFTKIHLDASMSLGSDPRRPLDPELSARRTAELARVAEESIPDPATAPRYVIGTEIPLPGGAQEHEDHVQVTAVKDVRFTLDVMHAAFIKEGLESAWERVIAVVVQPGVEFGDDFVLDYDPEATRDLAKFSEGTPLVFEAHSTDYQKRECLKNLVRDHFAILKVGPALTHAYREAVFVLAMMEAELFPAGQRSELIAVVEQAMLRRPEHWQRHYTGTRAAQAFARKYSLSDRMRYYWQEPAVQAAVEKLLANLEGVAIPRSLMGQFAPLAFKKIRSGDLPDQPGSVIDISIQAVLEDYQAACRPE